MSYSPRLNARKARLHLENLEERIALSWGGTPPDTITVPTSFTSVTLNGTGDATGNASIATTEIDWYRFTATANGTYQFDATTPSSNLDPVAALYSSTGNRLGYNDDVVPGSNTDSQFTVSLTNGQIYYFGVTNYNGTPAGSYTWAMNGPTPQSGPPDDAYEDNDTLATAANLGTITSSTTFNNLRLADGNDFFRFTMTGPGTASHSVSISFLHSQGNLDMALYNSAGVGVGASTSSGNGEAISLNGLAAGTYTVHIYASTKSFTKIASNYSLNINPGVGTGSAKVLYLQFDGASISRADLVRYAGSSWNPNMLDSDQNGINIGSFLSSRSDRETIISQMISMVQIDLNPYGITVQRLTAGAKAVEGVGATTIFLGQSTVTGGVHIACDIDQGNNNPTDIAFVGNEDWGSANSTAIAMADVTLHEGGHTWGLWHVASGTALESMGLRYNTSQSQWVQNTSFLDQTFNPYVSGGQAHGPGPQNAHQTMLAWSGGSGGGATGNLSQHDHDDHIDAVDLGLSYDDYADPVVPDLSRSNSVADPRARIQNGDGCGCSTCSAAAAVIASEEPKRLTTQEAATLAGMVIHAPFTRPNTPALRSTLASDKSFQQWRTQVSNPLRGVPAVQPSAQPARGQIASLDMSATDSLFLARHSRFKF